MRIASVVLLCLAVLSSAGCATPKGGPKRLSREQVAAMERDADIARAAFGQCQYETACAKLKVLAKDFTTSQPLYLCELGSSQLMAGDEDGAFATFQEAYRLLECFYDARSEERARSLWGAECEKVYKGDPYERSMLSFLLGTMFLERNDFDNALACFKNGQLADSDVSSELYTSDFALLQMLEAKSYELREQPGMVEKSLEAGAKSFVLTHPGVRGLVSRKQILVNQLSEIEPSRARPGGRRKAEAVALEAEITEMDAQIEAKASEVDIGYLDPLLADYNVLLVVWSGTGPRKFQRGKYGERSVIATPLCRELRYEICVDGQEWHDAVQGLCDVTLQATTRGGRMMDDVLNGQAAFKSATDEIGDSLVDAADDLGGGAGVVALGLGLIAKGISASTKPEADVRCWQCLPDTVHVLALDLEPGTHEFTVQAYDKYLRVHQRKFVYNVASSVPVDVVWLMPASID